MQVPANEQWGPRQWLRVRLMALLFLGFLAYPVSNLLRVHRPAALVVLGAAGLAVWTACYVRVIWRSTIEPHHLDAPYALVILLVVGAAMVPLFGFIWLGSLAFYANALLLIELPRKWWLRSLGTVIGTFVVVGFAMGAPTGDVFGNAVQMILIGGLQAAFFRQIQDSTALRQARAELARLAVAEERLRIARDLHDVLGQQLSAMALKSELAARLVGRDPARAGAEIAEVESVARQALDEMRATVSGYRDTSLAGEVRTATALLTAAGVAVTISGVPVGLPPAVEEAAAWVVREATTNVVRHAKATSCGITMGREHGSVVVEVRDDGVAAAGYHAPVLRGTGLVGLTERVHALGGSVSAGPVDGWYTVRAVVPVAAPVPA